MKYLICMQYLLVYLILIIWFYFYSAQAVTNGDPLQAYASMQPYAGIGKYQKKKPNQTHRFINHA